MGTVNSFAKVGRLNCGNVLGGEGDTLHQMPVMAGG
jgi:hypothetical protein